MNEDKTSSWVMLLLLGGALAVLIAIVYAIPLLLAYVVPFAIAAAAGAYGWRRACRISERERAYEWLAWLVPLTQVGVGVLLGGCWLAIRSDTLLDPFNELFHGLYNVWYGHLPFVGRAGSVSYCYQHFCVSVGIGILWGAPWVFSQIVRGDASEAKNHLKQWLWDQNEIRMKEHNEVLLDLQKRRGEYQDKADAFDAAVQDRDQEIERLRRREKYLTEGKPKPLQATPDKPDLDDF